MERICASAEDDRVTRLSILEEIHRAVPFESYAWLLTDPETSVGTAPLADVPCLPELPELIRLKYLCGHNRWTRLSGLGLTHVPRSAHDVSSEPSQWSSFLMRYGVSDVASVVFRDRHGTWGWLDLWRSVPDSGFGDSEAALLIDLLRPVTAALRRCQANTFGLHSSDTEDRPGPVVLLLSSDLRVVSLTPQAHDYLRLLVPPAHDQAPIPAIAYNVAAQLLAVEADVDDNPPTARMHLAASTWVTARATRLDGTGPDDQRDIVVTIEQSSPAERVGVFARGFGLSPREGELIRHLLTGIDTREIARRMFVSEHTVQDYLKAIFAKTSARNRRTVLSRALGT